jgi:membrane protein DedA with SNARE-associated domain
VQTLSEIFQAHGLLAVFAGVFVEQLGAPIPALPFLVFAGARSVGDPQFAAHALAVSCAASLLADFMWFIAGRRHGRALLAWACRAAPSSPDCMHRRATHFSRWGAASIVVAKFVPGMSTVVRPLAGAMGLRATKFIALDLVGCLVWAAAGIGCGFAFPSQVATLLAGLDHVVLTVGRLAALTAAGYAVWLAARALCAKCTKCAKREAACRP